MVFIKLSAHTKPTEMIKIDSMIYITRLLLIYSYKIVFHFYFILIVIKWGNED